jgi:hypothetical protein
MVPENPTQLDPQTLAALAANAAGQMDDGYAARAIEAMMFISDLALPDLAQQILEAQKNGHFLRGVVREVGYDDHTKRGQVWIEPTKRDGKFRDEDVDKANANDEHNWKMINGAPAERFPTERLFENQGRAVYQRAKQLVGHRVTFAKYVYDIGGGKRARDIVAILDNGPENTTSRPAPAPTPTDEQAPAPAPVPEPAPAPADEQAPAPAVAAAPEPAPEPAPDTAPAGDLPEPPLHDAAEFAAYVAEHYGVETAELKQLAKEHRVGKNATADDFARLLAVIQQAQAAA